MENELEIAVRRLANRKLCLRVLRKLDAPKTIIETGERIVKRGELLLQIAEKKLELKYYKFWFQVEDKTREDYCCPGCKYMYETPSGRRLTQEEIISGGCTLHPGKEYKGYCEDFEDYGIVKWNAHFKQVYEKIRIIKNMIEGTEKEISKLEQKVENKN